MDTTFNRQTTDKRGGLRSTSWKPGESGNPKGRPKDEYSLSNIMGQVQNMTSDEILDTIGRDNPLGQQVAQYPKRVQVKWLFAIRWAAALLFEPNGVMIREWLDRMEGRVPFRAEFDGKLTVEDLGGMLDRVYGDVIDAEVDEPKQLEEG